MTAEKTVSRLLLYRHLLARLLGEGGRWVHSQDIADQAGVHAVQVRRDLMVIGYTGTPAHGYDIALLFKALGRYLDAPDCQNAVLVGIGRLGSAILAYFHQRLSPFRIVAAFDRNPRRVSRSLFGCPCHPLDRMHDVIREHQIRVALLAVPAGAAQSAADAAIGAGVLGLINFAPIHLHVAPEVFVENMDITATLEKVAFFARTPRCAPPPAKESAALETRPPLSCGDPERPDAWKPEPSLLGARP